MKIAHITIRDGKGGANRAALRLHKSLRRMGVESNMLVSEKITDESSIHVLPRDTCSFIIRRLQWRNLPIKFYRYWLSRPRGFTLFSDHRSRRGAVLNSKISKYNILNLHWVAHLIDLPSFFKAISKEQSIIWTLHDMNPFTGGCHYSLKCEKHTNECGCCPQLGSSNPKDISHKIWEEKKEIFYQLLKSQLHLVAPSKWMAKKVMESSLMGQFPVSVIPYGLDTHLFSPQDKNLARKNLGIAPEAKIILFVANNLRIRHKGFSVLLETLNEINHIDGLLLVSVGSGKPDFRGFTQHKHLGHIENIHQIAQVYNAADIFVIPSLQDNLPNTVMEAMACGTPIVGFDVGGIPDMVRSGINGILVPPRDIRSLRSAIEQIIENKPLRLEMSKNCRQIIIKEFSQEIQASRYIELYKSLYQ